MQQPATVSAASQSTSTTAFASTTTATITITTATAVSTDPAACGILSQELPAIVITDYSDLELVAVSQLWLQQQL